MKKTNRQTKTTPPGPAPLRVRIEGGWEAAMGKAVKVSKPADGWPKPAPMPQRAPKTRKRKAQ